LNYSSRVFEDIQKSINRLIGSENVLSRVNKNLISDITKYASAGLLAATLSQNFAQSIFNIAASSRKGAGDFARLNQNLFLTKQAFSDTFYEVIKGAGILDLINNSLNTLRDNKVLQYLAVGALALGTALTGLVAIVSVTKIGFMALGAVLNVLGIDISIFKGKMVMMTSSTTLLNMSVKSLAASFSLALGAFSAFFALGLMLPENMKGWAKAIGIVTAAVAALAVALAFISPVSLATFGGAGFVKSAGMLAAISGAGLAVGASMPSYPIGTRSVPETG
jgi:hypothetical protein